MGTAYNSYRNPCQKFDGTWIVSDTYFAGFLIARGNQIIGVEASGQTGRLVFVISPRADFHEDVQDWHANAPIPVKDFLDGFYAAKKALREK
jgi:hypothetical protein